MQKGAGAVRKCREYKVYYSRRRREGGNIQEIAGKLWQDYRLAGKSREEQEKAGKSREEQKG